MNEPTTEAGRRLLALDDFGTAALDDDAMLGYVLEIERQARAQNVSAGGRVTPKVNGCICQTCADRGVECENVCDTDLDVQCPACLDGHHAGDERGRRMRSHTSHRHLTQADLSRR